MLFRSVISSTLSFSDTQVRVKAKLLQNKTIPVKAQIIGKPAKGYQYVGVDCLPEKIEIAGSERVLADISELVIPVDISGLTSTSTSLEQEVEVRQYLSDKITIPEEYQRISIKITIEKLLRKKIQIKAGDIKLQNVERKCVAEAYDKERILEFTVEGRESVLNGLSGHDISAYADCAGLPVGIHKLTVKFGQNPPFKLIKGDFVRIVIREQDNPQDLVTQPPVATEEPTEAPEESEAPSEEPGEE